MINNFNNCSEFVQGTSTVQDLHETRLELQKEAKEKGLTYDEYVGAEFVQSKNINKANLEGEE